MPLYYEDQYFTTTLSVIGGINASVTTGIVAQSVSGVTDTTKPGIALLNYADPLDTNACEWITYTSINSTTKTFVGVTRGAEGFAAKAHSNGVTIAFPHSRSHINNLVDAMEGNYTFAGTKTFSSDINLATDKNIQVNGADPTRTIFIPSGSMKPTTTAGCASVATIEAGTNDVDYDVLGFDTATDESAFFAFQMPGSWDGGTITFQAIWTAASGSGNVVFNLKGRAYANDDAIDQAYGTAQQVDDTLITAADIHISPESSAITIGGSPAAGQWCQFKITRDVSEDSLGVDARLIGVRILYKVGQYSD
jgi:hypothetical protein